MTEYYLLNHECNYAQYGYPRRNDYTALGQITFHSAENDTDLVGVDKGAEAVARYLTNRYSYGSYHDLTDRDSHIPLAPIEFETWHSVPTNNWATGISMALAVEDLDNMGKANRVAYFRRAAEAAKIQIDEFNEKGISVPIDRFLTREEALNQEPGITTHSRTDPDRRSDPFGNPGEGNTEKYEAEFLAILNETVKNSEIDMVDENTLRRIIREVIQEEVGYSVWDYQHKTEKESAYKILRDTREIPYNTLAYKVGKMEDSVLWLLRSTNYQVMQAAGDRAGLLEAIRQITDGAPIDLEAISEASRRGSYEAVKSSLGELEADVDLTIKGK